MKQYSIDPSLISLEEFKELTANRKMLPGRVVLHEQIDKRFCQLKHSGMETLGDLLRILGSKSKIQSLAKQTGLPENYLVLLKREAGSYLSRPFPLSSFPGIPFEYTELLKSRRINSTKNFFEQMQTQEQQAELSLNTGIPAYRLNELYSLCDLSRITGVGGIFARILYEAGIRCTEAFASSDISTLLNSCQLVIEKHGYAAGKLGEEDLKYGINYASVIVSCDHKSEHK